MSTSRYEVIGSALSPFVRKVRAVLAFKGLAYDLTDVNIFAPPQWFAALSPLRRIPVLRDRSRSPETGGAVLNDSSVICAYLDAEHPNPPLLPADPWLRGKALWIEEYMDSEFAFRMGIGVFRPRVVAPLLGKPVDEALVEKTLNEHAPRFYRYLEGEIADKDWFAGEAMSLADVAVATQFVNTRLAGEMPNPEHYPRLAAFLGRMFASPPFAGLMDPV